MRVFLNLLRALDWFTGLLIRPMVFFLLAEVIFLVLKGVSVTYGCTV